MSPSCPPLSQCPLCPPVPPVVSPHGAGRPQGAAKAPAAIMAAVAIATTTDAMAAAGLLLPAEVEALVQALRGTKLRDAGGQGCGGVPRGKGGGQIWGVPSLGGVGGLLRGWDPVGLRGVSVGCPSAGLGCGVPRDSGRGVSRGPRGCKCGVCPPHNIFRVWGCPNLGWGGGNMGLYIWGVP